MNLAELLARYQIVPTCTHPFSVVEPRKLPASLRLAYAAAMLWNNYLITIILKPNWNQFESRCNALAMPTGGARAMAHGNSAANLL
jgi:hypothetical protein